MDWVTAALASAALFGVISIFDKRILSVHVRSISAFYVLIAFLQLIMGVLVMAVHPWEGWGSARATFSVVINGPLWGAGLLLLFYGLRSLEVSRVIPIYHTFPVFAAILAVVFLGEEILPVHWLGILAVVAGAGSITLGQTGGVDRLRQRRAYIAVLIGAVFTGAATVTNKVALDEMDFWNVLALRQLMVGGMMLLPGLRRDIVARLREQIADRTGVALIVLGEGVLAFAAVYVTLVALDLGPVSLAATLMSVRPFFVLVFSALLSTRLWHILDEPVTRDTLALKLASTAMILGGVGLLSLV